MTELRALSYNVRYAGADDHHDAWSARREGVVALLRYHAPDVLALQEPQPNQRRFLAERLPAYSFRGDARTEEGEYALVGYRSDRFAAVDGDTLWLSETPGEPSVGWDGRYPRIATWVRLRTAARELPRGDPGDADPAGDATEFVVCSTHFDHEGARARLGGARLLRDRLPEVADGDPVVLLGDLNCRPGDPPHDALTGRFDDAAETAAVRHGPETSLTDFRSLLHGRRIDHALVSPGVDVRAFGTLADRDERGRYPSDHLPVAVRLRV